MNMIVFWFSFEIHFHKPRPHIWHQSPAGQQCGGLRLGEVVVETGKVQFTVREGAELRGATGASPGYDGDQASREALSGAVVWVCHMS